MSVPPAHPAPENGPLVVLLRSPDAEGEDRYVHALRERGFRATCRPVLRFTFAGDEDFAGRDLQVPLRHPDHYTGLVLTSPRAARALREALRTLPDQEGAEWTAKPAFAVGPKTAGTLREGGMEPLGEESGNAAALGAVIAKEMKTRERATPERPLLFLCGNRRRETLPRVLREANVPFEECVVYETHLRAGPWLEEAPAWAVFFSPSGMEAVQRSREAGWATVRKAAIGPTTAEALENAGWPPDAVARHPTPGALAEALGAPHNQEPPA